MTCTHGKTVQTDRRTRTTVSIQADGRSAGERNCRGPLAAFGTQGGLRIRCGCITTVVLQEAGSVSTCSKSSIVLESVPACSISEGEERE